MLAAYFSAVQIPSVLKRASKICNAVAKLKFGVPNLARDSRKSLEKLKLASFLCELCGAIGELRQKIIKLFH